MKPPSKRPPAPQSGRDTAVPDPTVSPQPIRRRSTRSTNRPTTYNPSARAARRAARPTAVLEEEKKHDHGFDLSAHNVITNDCSSDIECPIAQTLKPKVISRVNKVYNGPDLPHSSTASIPAVAKSSLLREMKEDCPNLTCKQHGLRAMDHNLPQRTKKQALKLPPPSDKRWREVESMLDIILPSIFTDERINREEPQKLIKALNDWLHAFFLEHFGARDSTTAPPKPFTARKNKALTRLRDLKKRARRAYRDLIRAGFAVDDPVIVAMKARRNRLMQQHNKLRLRLQHQAKARLASKSTKEFKKDPNAYARKLFKGSAKSSSPTFTKEEAEKYFRETYHDSGRDHQFSPLEGMKRPAVPLEMFDTAPPTLVDLQRIVKKKRNKAAPGFNALSYVPYKKCDSILKVLVKIFGRIWQLKKIPEEWAIAYIILLSKSDKLNLPGEFRPIALTNCDGKIFFSLIGERAERYFVRNEYINRAKQKGFLSEIPGCVEHSFALVEALKEAKRSQAQIVSTWIDLANAYGSVRHNLIQFALNWYHVPEFIQALIFDYYNKLCAQVVTEEWETGFFLFDIGLFQGCVLSTILFDAVFNLLLDFLDPLEKEVGFAFKGIAGVKGLSKAYADDLTLTTSTPAGNQLALDETVRWLDWTVTMRAKPKKCFHIAYKRFDPRTKRQTHVKYDRVQYSVFDAKLVIKGEPVHFIHNPANPDAFKQRHFKFLGRYIDASVTETRMQQKVKEDLLRYLNICERDSVNGLCKLWLYQHHIINYMAWPFFTHDFARSFVVELQPTVNTFLRRWGGIYKSSDQSVLYRPRAQFGLQLTSLVAQLERMQVVCNHLLNHSQDAEIRRLAGYRAEREANISNWRGSQLYSQCKAIAEHDNKFKGQSHRQGLGNGNYNPLPSIAEHRKMVSSTVLKLESERLMAHSCQLLAQSRWTHWVDTCEPYDLSWKNLIWKKSADQPLIKFILNATQCTNNTPAMLKLWNYTNHARCPLCGHDNCTIRHILSSCDVARNQGRTSWRHDSVLNVLQPFLEEWVAHVNALPQPKPKLRIAPLSSNFIAEKAKLERARTKKKQPRASIMPAANDWELLIDYENKEIVFPPDILPSDQRPDIIIWSHSLRTVILCELTCPGEESIRDAQSRKKIRYAELVKDCRSLKPSWTTHFYTIEACVRGMLAFTFRKFLSSLGLSPSITKQICHSVSRVVARCSYYIYQSRKNLAWNKKRALLTDDYLQRAAPAAQAIDE